MYSIYIYIKCTYLHIHIFKAFINYDIYICILSIYIYIYLLYRMQYKVNNIISILLAILNYYCYYYHHYVTVIPLGRNPDHQESILGP